MADIHAEVSRGGAIPVIQVSGDLDGEAGEVLDAAFSEAIGGDAEAVVLDLEALGFMNSSGIALVVGLLARARGQDIEVRTCGLTDHYRHIFEITRLTEFLSIWPDVRFAIAGDEAATT